MLPSEGFMVPGLVLVFSSALLLSARLSTFRIDALAWFGRSSSFRCRVFASTRVRISALLPLAGWPTLAAVSCEDVAPGPENVVLVTGKNMPPAWVAGLLTCAAVLGPENVVLVIGKNMPPACVAGLLPCAAAVLGPEN